MKDFERVVEEWLRDESKLKLARTFLENSIPTGPRSDMLNDSLSDVRIANWLRSDRDFPAVLVAGAALGYIANSAQGPEESPANVVGKEFWQLFVVDEPLKGAARCNGKAFRYWTGVRPLKLGSDAVYFSHQSYYSADIPDGDNKIARDLLTGEAVERQLPEKRDDEGKRPAGCITVSWELTSLEPRDFGYSVQADDVVAADNSQERYDYVGGMSSIPVDRAITIVKLPSVIFAQSNIFTQSKTPVLHSLEFLQGATSFRMIEQYLSETLHPRYLGPWFKRRGEPQLPVEGSKIRLPPPLQKHLQDHDEKHLQDHDEKYVYFQIETSKPAPYLTYLAAFELKKAGMKE